MTLTRSRWRVVPEANPDAAGLLVSELDIPVTLAQVLVQRGYSAPEDAKGFLRPSLESLSDPMLMKDMDVAVGIVAEAVKSGETILVHGDYDVDGQCAAALLTRLLRLAGGKVVPFVPHRMRDGYDFGQAGLETARAHNATLVITCDCGITATETVTEAKKLGIKVVITDHHLPRDLPPADAVINPRRPDCQSPCKDLCGAGVAFKLVQALCREFGMDDNTAFHFLDLVAFATVADIVPLVGENRTMARFGLRMMQKTRWPGLKAMLRITRLDGQPVKAGHVSFVLAPRLNAAGRLDDANDGLSLLLSDDDAEAFEYAQKLEAVNSRRQEIDKAIHDDAIAQVERLDDLDSTRGLVLSDDSWHPGVIGIVASRIAETYMRPTFLVAFDGDEGRRSGRSIEGFDLHDALSECAPLLDRWGGHRFAAGITVQRNKLDEFREAFDSVAGERLSEDDLVPTQRVDIVGPVNRLNAKLERLLRHLEPCGSGNPGPVFGVRNAMARVPTTVGKNHLKFTLEDETGNIPAIGFGWANRVADNWWKEPVDVALRLDRNEWRGRSTLQARVVQIKNTDQ